MRAGWDALIVRAEEGVEVEGADGMEWDRGVWLTAKALSDIRASNLVTSVGVGEGDVAFGYQTSVARIRPISQDPQHFPPLRGLEDGRQQGFEVDVRMLLHGFTFWAEGTLLHYSRSGDVGGVCSVRIHSWCGRRNEVRSIPAGRVRRGVHFTSNTGELTIRHPEFALAKRLPSPMFPVIPESLSSAPVPSSPETKLPVDFASDSPSITLSTTATQSKRVQDAIGEQSYPTQKRKKTGSVKRGPETKRRAFDLKQGHFPHDVSFYRDPISLDWLEEPIFVRCLCFQNFGRFLERESLEQLIRTSTTLSTDDGTSSFFTTKLKCPVCQQLFRHRSLATHLGPNVRIDVAFTQDGYLDEERTVINLKPAVDKKFKRRVQKFRKAYHSPVHRPTIMPEGTLLKELRQTDPLFDQEMRDREYVQAHATELAEEN